MYETIGGGAAAGVVGGVIAMVLHNGLRDYQQYRKDRRALPAEWWRVTLSDGRDYILNRHTYHRVCFVIRRFHFYEGDEESFDKGYTFPEGCSIGSSCWKFPGVLYLTWEINHLFEGNMKNLAQRGLLLEKEDGYYLTLDGWEWFMERAWWKRYMLFYRSYWAYRGKAKPSHLPDHIWASMGARWRWLIGVQHG